MKKDKLIKDELLSVCEPEKSFEQFCRENNLPVEKRSVKKQGARGWLLKAVMPALSAVAVVLAIVLPITLSGDVVIPEQSDSSTAPTLAMHSDTITIEEVLSDSEITLLNIEYMFDEYTSFRKMYVDGKASDKNHVGYSVSTDVYGANINGVPYVYGFTMTTAKRNVLSGLDKHLYYGCDKTISINDVDYNYKVSTGLSVGMFVYYQIGKYEYCISVEPLGTAAIADEPYMQTFLQLAFGTVEDAEPLNISDYITEGKNA